MSAWRRISLVAFVLIGGTLSFGYWSFNQFNSAFDTLSTNYSNTSLAAVGAAKSANVAVSRFEGQINGTSTTISTSGDQSTSTSTPISIASSTSTIIDSDIVTKTSLPDLSVDPKFKIVFPLKNSVVYTGCTYSISWVSSTTITYFDSVLIDAGTRKTSGPIASGISRENTIDSNSQFLKWNVGNVWPGTYFISISNINHASSTNISSKVFTINDMPAGLKTDEQKNICETGNGSLEI